MGMVCILKEERVAYRCDTLFIKTTHPLSHQIEVDSRRVTIGRHVPFESFVYGTSHVRKGSYYVGRVSAGPETVFDNLSGFRVDSD